MLTFKTLGLAAALVGGGLGLAGCAPVGGYSYGYTTYGPAPVLFAGGDYYGPGYGYGYGYGYRNRPNFSRYGYRSRPYGYGSVRGPRYGVQQGFRGRDGGARAGFSGRRGGGMMRGGDARH